jgi:small subunit ribosomal protein S4
MEKQFENYFDKALTKPGVTGEELLILLERRLDNVIYRLGFCASRPQSRQYVTHGHFTVNGKKVNIPSYQVSEGDVIAVKESSRDLNIFKALRENGGKLVPKWLEMNVDALSGKVVALPKRDDIDLTIEEHLIVELYSR